MKRLTVISVVLILVSTILDAQQGTDTLYLKNGTVITGDLIRIKGKEVLIKTADNILFTSSEEIARFVRNGKPVTEETTHPSLIDFNGWGFGISNSLILSSGSHEDYMGFNFSLHLSVTYTFKSRHTASIVTGVEYYNLSHIPLIIDYRYNLLIKNVSPFVYARGGGLITIKRENTSTKGGLTYGLGTGFRWPMGNIESYVTFGFRHVIIYLDNNLPELKDQYNSNKFETGWGFKF